MGSPNVIKVIIALEEMNIPYRLCPVDVSKGEHHDPNNVGGLATGKLPIIVDEQPADSGESFAVFESGAILQYLAEKSGSFLPSDARSRSTAMQWLFWQMANVGPIMGQAWHFLQWAPLIAPDVDNSYSYNRYFKMFTAICKTMDRRLGEAEYLAGEYSIADMACYPWIAYLEPLEGIESYPNILRWKTAIAEREAVIRAYEAHLTVDMGYERTARGAPMLPLEGVVQHVVIA
ncbi:MAG: glutathione S-transferase N-terminal domain-containing protein [Pseudomonadota bacterium]